MWGVRQRHYGAAPRLLEKKEIDADLLASLGRPPVKERAKEAIVSLLMGLLASQSSH
jgi:hypothetical protein